MKAAIFDMDGLLIDSEPLWQAAEIAVFRSVGVMLTRELCRDTMGLRVDEVVSYWYGKFPWRSASLKAVEKEILAVVGRLVIERGEPMPGAKEVVELLRAANYKLAVASSSPMGLIVASLEKFGLTDYFSVLHSADAEEEGKPHPGVYVSTITRLGASPSDCIAFEDSVVGVRAAKAAGAQVIAVPDAANTRDPGFAKADVVLSSLTDFSLDLVQ
jgi:HAD superfamily hydrolase (TIGR01509 family)